MVQINLLPWRQQLREEDRNKFLKNLVLSSLSALGLVLSAQLYSYWIINSQKERNALLTHQLLLLDNKIANLKQVNQQLEPKLTKFNKLSNIPLSLIHFLQDLVKIFPSDLYLLKIEKEKQKIRLLGYSLSNEALSILMNRIRQNKWIQKAALAEIKSVEDGYQFNLTIELR